MTMGRRFQLDRGDARSLAFQALYRIFEEEGYTNLTLQSFLLSQDPPEIRRRCTAMVYGTTTRRVTLDYILGRFLKGKQGLDGLQPAVRTVLRMAAWELCYGHNSRPAATIDEACKLTARVSNKGAVGLVNAVLRSLSTALPVDLPARPPGLRHSVIPELAGLFKKWYGEEEATSILDAFLEEERTTVRLRRPFSERVIGECLDQKDNKDAMADLVPARFMPAAYFFGRDPGPAVLSVPSAGPGKAYASDLGNEPYSIKVIDQDADPSSRSRHSSIEASPLFKAGLLAVQGEGAMLAGHLLGARPGELILDACAAPGGKTCQIADTMADTGTVIACDVHPSRLKLIEDNARRLGITCIQTLLHDATTPFDVEEHPWFDRVLADVPCSGLGQLANRPELRFRMTYEKIQSLCPLQQQILRQAAAVVRPGGRLVYSTCTLNPLENGGQLDDFLAEHDDFVTVNLCGQLPERLLELDPSLVEEAKRGRVTLRPDRHHCDGFFVGVLERRAD